MPKKLKIKDKKKSNLKRNASEATQNVPWLTNLSLNSDTSTPNKQIRYCASQGGIATI